MVLKIDNAELLALEDDVMHALATGDESRLDVLGYGEVTLVLRLKSAATGKSMACKRLPVFPSKDRFDRYRDSLERYLAALEEKGVRVAPTQLWSAPVEAGRIVAYCVQETLDVSCVGHRWLKSASHDDALAFFRRVLETAEATVTPTLGIDGQVSNWVVGEDGSLTYLDITTPLMRDRAGGQEILDVKLFMSSLPVGLRDVVRITMSKDIFDKFYSVRGVVLDLCGNLLKEKLDALVPEYLAIANPRLPQEITMDDVRSYYADDAKLWELIQRLRRLDRFVQNKVLKTTYPFLLPRAIER